MRLYIQILSILIFFGNIANADSMPTPYPDGGIPTLNGMGAMAPDLDDPITQDFIKHAKSLSGKDKVLEVGTAYGNLVLELLKTTKVSITANDLDSKHLDILHNRALECCKKDINRLTLHPANFSNEKALEANSYSAIMFHSVLLFMKPAEIEQSFERAYELLKKGGKIYIYAVSPYAYDSFVPEYKSRLSNKVKWPGFVEDMSRHSEYIRKRPKNKSIFTIDQASLKELLEIKGFVVQDIFGMEWDKKTDSWIRIDNGSFTGAVAVKM